MRAATMVWVLSLCVLGLAVLASGQGDIGGEVSDVTGDGADGGLPGGDPVEVVTDPAFTYGVAAGAVAVGLGAWFMFRGGAKFVTKDNVLENETRADLYDFLGEKPGTHLRGIADELDLSTTNVLWHLRKLEDADLVRSKKLEGYKVFYRVEGGQEGKRRAMASSVLRNENAQSVLEYISAHPGAHQREIARALDVNHGTVRWHLRKMLNTDLLLQVRREHAIQYYLTDLGVQMLGGDAAMPQNVRGHEGESAAA
ncbi:MAG: winged helix-turn-helix transcriptional regulator [Candidatus Thermoplasmatota archaeon]|nr:winged helix-turn-helix transcriptional regulator [Candidatus Thermoplasmatota archaeon]